MKDRRFLDPLDILELFAGQNLPENFCIVPFSNLIFNPNGDVGVCRQKGTKHVVGNISQNTVEEIWNSEYMQRWREEFLSGEVKICQNEIVRDACHLSTSNYHFFSEIDIQSLMKDIPLKFTANFNGKCNLRCRMCDIWTMENGFYDKIDFWETAEKEFFPFIKEIELLSGEPFIQQDTWRLIEIIGRVNPDCLWSFTTNGHWRLNAKMKSQLDKIKIKNIIVSIDSFDPELYSQIRIDGNLQVVLDNLELLSEYSKEREAAGKSSLGLTLHYLVMKDNWQEIPSVIDLVEKLNMRLTLNNLYEPHEQSISSLSIEEQVNIVNDLLVNNSWTKIQRMMRTILSIANDLPPIEKAVILSQINDFKRT